MHRELVLLEVQRDSLKRNEVFRALLKKLKAQILVVRERHTESGSKKDAEGIYR